MVILCASLRNPQRERAKTVRERERKRIFRTPMDDTIVSSTSRIAIEMGIFVL